MCLCVCWLVLYNVTTGSKDSDFSLTGKAVIFKLLNLFLFYVRPTCQPNEIAKFYQIRKIFINNYKCARENVHSAVTYSFSFVILSTKIHFTILYTTIQYIFMYICLQTDFSMPTYAYGVVLEIKF